MRKIRLLFACSLLIIGCGKSSVTSPTRTSADHDKLLKIVAIEDVSMSDAQWGECVWKIDGRCESKAIYLNLSGQPWASFEGEHEDGRCYVSSYPTPEDFKEGLIKTVNPFVRADAVVAGNIQGLSYEDKLVLLVPGAYFDFYCLGLVDPDGRFPVIYPKILKSISWTDPIDTTSKEFLDWKAHILALIEEARQSSLKKSSLTP